MDITTTTDGTLATLAVVGTIDTRASTDFERALAKAIEGGGLHVIIDFTRIDLITSSGIRVLVLFAKRLHGIGGGLVLCSLSPDVQRVFDIAGLTAQFRIAPTRAAGAAALTGSGAAPRKSRGSRVARLVGSLLGGRDEASGPERPGGRGERSPLTSQVARLLGDEKPRPPRS